MLRSRMFTTGFRLAFGLALLYLFMAFAFAVSTTLQVPQASAGDMLTALGLINVVTGPITMGWKGGVGNHLGYLVFLGATAATALIGFVLVAFRDADAEAGAQVLELESAPLTRAPNGASFVPLMAAVSVAVLGIGWVSNPWVVYAGVGLLLLTAATWTIRAWAERATGDDEVNFGIYKQIIDPFRVPIVAAGVIAFVVLAFSRVLLAAPSIEASQLLFLGVSALIFVVVVAVAAAPKLGRSVVTALLVIFGLAMLAGLVYGAVEGEREIHGTEAPAGGGSHGGGGTEGGSHEGGLAPISPAGATR